MHACGRVRVSFYSFFVCVLTSASESFDVSLTEDIHTGVIEQQDSCGVRVCEQAFCRPIRMRLCTDFCEKKVCGLGKISRIFLAFSAYDLKNFTHKA